MQIVLVGMEAIAETATQNSNRWSTSSSLTAAADEMVGMNVVFVTDVSVYFLLEAPSRQRQQVRL